MATTESLSAERAQVEAYIQASRAIADCIRELGEVPSGHLYARVMDKMSLDTYQSIIKILKGAKLVKESNHLLTWIGPRPKGSAK